MPLRSLILLCGLLACASLSWGGTNHGTPDMLTEIAARGSDQFPAFVGLTGCSHGTSATRVSPSFACQAYARDGTDITQAALTVDYTTAGATATDTCWLA